MTRFVAYLIAVIIACTYAEAQVPEADTAGRSNALPALTTDTTTALHPLLKPADSTAKQTVRDTSFYNESDYPDSSWNLDTLNAKNYNLNSLYDSTIISSGWFPRIIKPYFSTLFTFGIGDTYDYAKSITSRSFAVRSRFDSDMHLDDDERKTKAAFSDGTGDPFPQTTYVSFGITEMVRCTPITFFYFGLNYVYNESLLSSIDNSKSYLGRSGGLIKVKEATVIDLTESGIEYKLGFAIPIYGAFTYVARQDLSMVYTLTFGLSGSYRFSSKADQFLFLADNKDDVRYSNGRDRFDLTGKKNLSTAVPARYWADIGFNVLSLVKKGAGTVGVEYSFPLTSVLSDSPWKQHFLKLIITLGFDNSLF